jgi:hypothetical protein
MIFPLLSLGIEVFSTRICNFFMMRQHLDAPILGAAQPYHNQHDSIALSLAWLSIYIMPRPSHPSSVVASMTRQHRCQHDSISTSRHGQVTLATLLLVRLDSIVAIITQHIHRTVAKSPKQHRCQHDSAPPSPGWPNIFIATQPSCPDSIINSMT